MGPVRSLYNGVDIPEIGFGTFRMDDDAARLAVYEAVQAGYRHIDTASFYGNEYGVGQALKESGVSREELFITSKVWNTEQGFHAAMRAFDESRHRLDTEYLDLYLIHWPKDLSMQTWSALEKLYEDGKVRSIGVSNFKIHHLQELLDGGEMVPMVNQVELHPQFPQKRLRGFCSKFDILIEAWGPLMQGEAFAHPLLIELADQYRRSISQIVLRWHLQTGSIPLPKTTHSDRMRENLMVYDFELSQEDMQRIGDIAGSRIGPDPDSITF